MNCPLCNTLLIHKIDEEYFTCVTCKALVKDQQFYPNSSEEKARYNSHNNDVEDVRYQNFTSPITNYILENFQPQQKGLDFGSGPGPVISNVLKKQKYQVAQYDPYFANHPKLLNQTYDYIFACEVVEHFYKPYQEFERLKAILNNGGSLLLMTLLYEGGIDFKNWHYRKDPTHVFIYSLQTFEWIKKRFCFQQLKIKDRLIVLQ